jgi:hypothetical protein
MLSCLHRFPDSGSRMAWFEVFLHTIAYLQHTSISQDKSKSWIKVALFATAVNSFKQESEEEKESDPSDSDDSDSDSDDDNKKKKRKEQQKTTQSNQAQQQPAKPRVLIRPRGSSPLQ